MAATTMATAAGGVVLLFFILNRIISSEEKEDGDYDRADECSKSSRSVRLKRKIARRPAQAPATWLETLSTLSETLRFTYSETLGKWPIGDLTFGIKYLLRRQGDLQVASVYSGENCTRLEGPEIIADLKHCLRLLTFCMLFSKKPFPVFLELAGYSHGDVLLQKAKAGILKPAFTILSDKNSKCFLLLIRGTHSIKDTLTAVTGAVVPFHHSVLHDGGISNLVLGYAHCGMVAAARWIAKLSTPFLLKALKENPDYEVKIVGHSLGGGTAALLTYIIREQKGLCSTTCITFAPAACMTWELAESGKHFITTIINSSDLVPTFSTASLDDLRSEVTASSWLNDLRDQVERTRVLNVVYRSATALGSRLPSLANARERVAGAGALLRPVSHRTQIVMKHAQDVAQAVVKTHSTLTSWSCMGPRRRGIGMSPNYKHDEGSKAALIVENTHGYVTPDAINTNSASRIVDCCSSSGGSYHGSEEEEENLIQDKNVISNPEDITENELWYELEKELQRQEEDQTEVEALEEEEAGASSEEIREEDELDSKKSISPLDVLENRRFYPPGRVMHIVSIVLTSLRNPGNSGHDGSIEERERVSIYETPRDLYSKIRLSRTMVNDHYMPMYKKMMERLLAELENDVKCAM